MPHDLPAIVDGSQPISNATLLAAATAKMAEYENAVGVEVLVAADENEGLEALVAAHNVGGIVRVRRGGLNRMAGVIIPLFASPDTDDDTVEVDTSEVDNLVSVAEVGTVVVEGSVYGQGRSTTEQAFGAGNTCSMPADQYRALIDALGFYAHSEQDDRGVRARAALSLIEGTAVS